MNKTAVDLYEEKSRELIHLYVNGDIDVRELLTRQHNIYYDIKEIEQQQSEQKDSVISQIDLELSLLDDAITTLRKKLYNYYTENNYE
jgi:hypothetical protein